MKNSHDIVKGLLRSEKGSNMMSYNKYTFWVDSAANKIEIRSAVQSIYNVKVKDVNVMNVRGKKKRVRYQQGMISSWKKAIVTLAAGDKIEIAA